MIRAALAAVLATACGRVEFAPLGDGGTADGAPCTTLLCLDTTFRGGVVTIDDGLVDNSTYAARGVAERPDGRLVVIGKTGPDGATDGLVVGLLENGDRDPAFGTAGKVVLGMPSTRTQPNGVAVMSDDRVVVVGGSDAGGFVVRLAADGAPDPTFTPVATQLATSDTAFNGLSVDAAGKVTVAGQTRATSFDFALARFTGDGSPDSTFGVGGEAITGDSSDEFGTLGAPGWLVGQSYQGANGFDGAFAHFNNAGVFDTPLILTSRPGEDRFADLAIDAQDRPVVAGFAGTSLFVQRYTPSGAVDASFAPVLVDAGANPTLYSVVVLDDGRILAGGTAGDRAVVLVIAANGAVQATQFLDLPAPARVATMIVDHAGRLVVMGPVPGNSVDLFVARFLVRG